ncbi:FAD-dependent oxidoreductase [Paraburkholderia guartelaensis]|uniref:FAD-dependent monooxygenase n=1 Tax=Paraburkholderia guartelaensis TaxID=2546446 RepID=A0ABU9S3W8_9BURK
MTRRLSSVLEPVGLAAALFLADQGMRTRIVDAAPQAATESRAQVVNPRALELLESTGVAQAMVAQGRAIHRTRFYEDWKLIAELEFAGAHPRYGMTILSQARSEALLAQALRERVRHNRSRLTATVFCRRYN